VEASSPGLTPASVGISAKAVKLRPQVAVWDREVPAGSGVTGLWRPAPVAAAAGRGGGGFGGGSAGVFTFRQNGGALTGSVEGVGGARGGGEAPVAIEDGKVDGANISFKAGNATYTGTVRADQIELQRTGGPQPGGRRPAPAEPTGPRPAIGPPPDGSDPSSGSFFTGGRGGGRGGPQGPVALVLVRSKR
jgi:beta-galactosidase